MDRRTLLTSVAALGAAALTGCARDDEPRPTPSRRTLEPSATASDDWSGLEIAGTVATGLNVPWGFAFLADGSALVSQRDDASVVRIAPGGGVSDLGRVPGLRTGGEAGLLGIALDPDDENVLFAYVTTGSDNRVVRMSLDGGRLGDPDPVLTGIPVGGRHHGGRLLFAPDATLFVATGDAGNGAVAQDRGALGGKILRITRDGRAADDNPFDNRTWSYGHRNIEGLAFDADGRLWASEFGEKSADELNLIQRGGNHGWPQVEGEGGGSDVVQPKRTWATSDCSPAGLAIARSTAFLGALQGECVWAVPLDGVSAGEPKRFLEGHGRIRNVVVAPDTSLWVSTSNTDGRATPKRDDDRIVRVTFT